MYHYASKDAAKHFWTRAIANVKAKERITTDATSDEQPIVRYRFSIAPPPYV